MLAWSRHEGRASVIRRFLTVSKHAVSRLSCHSLGVSKARLVYINTRSITLQFRTQVAVATDVVLFDCHYNSKTKKKTGCPLNRERMQKMRVLVPFTDIEDEKDEGEREK